MTLRHVFAPEMYRFDKAVPSYWEATATPIAYPSLSGDETVDVAIIGGGYTGLSAALHLAQDGVSAAVLEAGHIGWGASGRNGGFVCFPSAKLSAKQLIDRYGLEGAQHFFRTQVEGAELTLGLIRELGIDADVVGDGIYSVAHHPNLYPDLVEMTESWRRLFGLDIRCFTRDEFLERGHGGTESFGAACIAPGAGIHPLKFAIGLGAAAAKAGAKLFAHTRVERWERQGGLHRLHTPGGVVSAKRVIVAANGYMPDGLKREFDRRIIPAISNIIVTRPLTEGEKEACGWRTLSPCSNERRLLYYYRLLPDGRILLGGRGDATGKKADGAIIRAELVAGLERMFPALKGIAIDYFWRGLVCMTRSFTPAIGRLEEDPSTYFAFGYHGNGVANAPWGGRALAHAISRSNTGEVRVSPVQAKLPPRMPPFQWTRRLALRAAYAWYRRKDAAEER